MKYCDNCGEPLKDGEKFCHSCGAKNEAAAQADPDFAQRAAKLNDTPDTTAEFSKKDAEQNKAMAILAYLGILVLVPLFAAKDSKFARFHTNQGLVLAICEIAYGIIYGILSAILYAISWRLGFIVTIVGVVSVVFVILAIIGIMNASKGMAKELPVIGKFRILK